METFIINYIDITPNTSYTYTGRGLMLEREVDNFFNKSFKFADSIKYQSTEFHNNFYHLYIPIMEDQIYVRPLETLPHYEDQDKKYVEIITHLKNNLSSSDFKKFIQDYKRFLVDINCKKDILSKAELIIRHDEMQHYSVREIVSCEVSNRNKSISR